MYYKSSSMRFLGWRMVGCTFEFVGLSVGFVILMLMVNLVLTFRFGGQFVCECVC